MTLDRQRLISSKDRSELTDVALEFSYALMLGSMLSFSVNADSQCNIDMSLSSWLEGVDNIKAKMEVSTIGF